MKNTKKLYEYLDGYGFSNIDEIVWAISDFYYPRAWDDGEQPSRWELSEYWEIAIHYSEDRQLDFDFDDLSFN